LDAGSKKNYETRLESSLSSILGKKKREAQIMIQYRKEYKSAYEELVHRWIYIKKFGYIRYRNFFDGVSSINSIIYGPKKSIMDVITKKEKDLILIEKEKDDKFFQAMQNSRAPWVSISQRLRYAKTLEERKKLYHELKKYLPPRTPKALSKKIAADWIRSKEGFPIICPHVRDQIEMEIRGMTDKEIHDFLLAYAGETPLYDAYYCKICGEPMTYTDNMEGISMFEGEQPIMMYHDIEDGMKEYIWKQVNQVVRGWIEFRDIKTNKYINQFVSTITSDLYDIIILIDKQISKSKTNSLEEIEYKRKLQTYIYIWAVLIKIVLENPGKLKFVFQRDFQKIKSDVLFTKVLEKLLSTQDILLRKLKITNEASIQEALYTAYTNINALLSKSKVENPRPLSMEELVELDPIYWYISNIYVLQKLGVFGGKHFALGSNPAKSLFNIWEGISPTTIFGKDLDYEKPAIQKIGVGTAADGAKSDYFINCFNDFMRYIESRVWEVPIYNVSIAYDSVNPNLFTIHVAIREEHKKFRESMTKTFELEQTVFTERRKENAYPIGALPFVRKRTYPYLGYMIINYPDFLLDRMYGESVNKSLNQKFLPVNNDVDVSKLKNKFHKHKWNITVYATLKRWAGFGLKHYKPNEVKSYHTSDSAVAKELTTSADFINLKVVDHLCDVCYNTLSSVIFDYSFSAKDVAKLDNVSQSVRKIIEREQTLVNFFNYYQNRCPAPSLKQIKEGDQFHIFITSRKVNQEDEKCSNCGVTKDMLSKRDSGYFEKFVKKFQETQKKERIPIATGTALDDLGKNELSLLEIPVGATIRNWKYNSNVVNEIITKTYDMVASKFKRPGYTHIWQNLGMVENYDYDKVISGDENPSALMETSPELIMMRINRLDIYNKEFLFDYDVFMNHKNMPSIPLEIKSILDTMNTSDLAKVKNLPDLDGNYFSNLRDIRYLYNYPEKHINIANFLLENLIHVMLHVMGIMGKTLNKKIAHEFFMMELNKILQSERTSSKMKDQKAAAVEAQTPLDMNQLNMEDHFQSRSFDGIVADDQGDKFSLNDMDYGGENDDINQ
jgi:hypothetical protein